MPYLDENVVGHLGDDQTESSTRYPQSSVIATFTRYLPTARDRSYVQFHQYDGSSYYAPLPTGHTSLHSRSGGIMRLQTDSGDYADISCSNHNGTATLSFHDINTPTTPTTIVLPSGPLYISVIYREAIELDPSDPDFDDPDVGQQPSETTIKINNSIDQTSRHLDEFSPRSSEGAQPSDATASPRHT